MVGILGVEEEAAGEVEVGRGVQVGEVVLQTEGGDWVRRKDMAMGATEGVVES